MRITVGKTWDDDDNDNDDNDNEDDYDLAAVEEDDAKARDHGGLAYQGECGDDGGDIGDFEAEEVPDDHHEDADDPAEA